MSVKIDVAKNCGFCFGVRRAVDTVYGLRRSTNKKIYIIGELIHNTVFIDRLKADGIFCISQEDALEISDPKNTILVIRTHGITKEYEEKIRSVGCEVIDATCPFVKRIHKIVDENSKDCSELVIVGDKNHPEVVGIESYSFSPTYVCSDENECSDFVNKLGKNRGENPLVVSQTTGNNEKYVNCQKIIKKVYTKSKIFDTICNVTENRQNEVKEMAKSANVMCIIGCTKSSNTKKLYQISSEYCKNTFLLETARELDGKMIVDMYENYVEQFGDTGCFTVGITAGASTPDDIIEEVKVKVENLLL